MEQFAYLAIGASVLLHVSWNLLARHVDSQCNFLWWGLLSHLLLLGPWSLWALWQDADWQTVLYVTLAITALSNGIYFLALRRAYHYAAVSLVYPIARSSPLLIAIWSLLFFQQHIGILGWLGILISVSGLYLMGVSSKHGDGRHALPWALLAALSTSIYSLSDKTAVSYLPSFGSKMGFVTIGYLVSFLALSLATWKETGQWRPRCRPGVRYLIAGGLGLGTAYALVIHAMSWMPAAIAVAYTNAGIVIATILSIFWFGEKEAWRERFGAVAVICLGLLVVSASRWSQ